MGNNTISIAIKCKKRCRQTQSSMQIRSAKARKEQRMATAAKKKRWKSSNKIDWIKAEMWQM